MKSIEAARVLPDSIRETPIAETYVPDELTRLAVVVAGSSVREETMRLLVAKLPDSRDQLAELALKWAGLHGQELSTSPAEEELHLRGEQLVVRELADMIARLPANNRAEVVAMLNRAIPAEVVNAGQATLHQLSMKWQTAHAQADIQQRAAAALRRPRGGS